MGDSDDLNVYIKKHSAIGFIESDYIHLYYQKTKEAYFSNRICEYGLYPIGYDTVLFFCSQCVLEDVAELGYSYWRRIHNFPGVDVCNRHKSGLMRVADDINTFKLPHWQFDELIYPGSDFVESMIDRPLVQRYQEIASGMLDFYCPLNPSHVIQILENRCRELGILHGKNDWATALRDRIIKLAPQEWLEKHFVRGMSLQGLGIHPIHNINTQNWYPKYSIELVLALAATFESTDAALSRLCEDSKAVLCKKPTKSRRVVYTMTA